MMSKPREEIYKEIKKKLSFSDFEFNVFLEKLHSLKSLNDKEWEALQLIKEEIDNYSKYTTRTNFFISTINLVKTEDGWK